MADTISPDLAGFIAERNSLYLATASADGQPYIQHRGGPKGFLHVLDEKTLGFLDFAGNRQYISAGNLTENTKVYLFLMDYGHRQRIKIWGEATVVEPDNPEYDALAAKLSIADYKARAERIVTIRVTAWDANCPQHIPQKFDGEDVVAALEARDARIAELEARVETLTRAPGAGSPSES